MLGRLIHLLTLWLESGVDHVQPQNQEQTEGNPVVPGFDELTGCLTDKPADDGRDGFDHAEYEAGTECLCESWFLQARAFANGCREGIRGHGEG